MASAAEPEVFERSATQPRVYPEAENSLFRVSELSGAGHDAAAINPHRKSERMTVLERKELGGELGAAVERDWRLGGERLADPAFGNSGWQCAVERESVPDTPH